LSFPENSSINDGIPDHLCTVQYQTVDDAIKLVKFYGKNCLMAETDIENSFKIIPIQPDDQELLGFTIQGQYFCDKTLPMGLSYSCKLFEALSSTVHWIVDNKLNGCGCVHVLDDFLFVGQGNSPLCGQTFKKPINDNSSLELPFSYLLYMLIYLSILPVYPLVTLFPFLSESSLSP
jgi:hypothetical protein